MSYKRGNAYATMSKVIMGNGGFMVARLKFKVFHRDRRNNNNNNNNDNNNNNNNNKTYIAPISIFLFSSALKK